MMAQLTFNLINNFFLATGSEKAEIISKVIQNDISSEFSPASRVKPLNGRLKWYLDSSAGRNLI